MKSFFLGLCRRRAAGVLAAVVVAGAALALTAAAYADAKQEDEPKIGLTLHQAVLGGMFGDDLAPQPGDRMLYVVEVSNDSGADFDGGVSVGIPALAESRVLELGGGEYQNGVVRYGTHLPKDGKTQYVIMFELPDRMECTAWTVQAMAHDGKSVMGLSNAASCEFGEAELSATQVADDRDLVLRFENAETSTGGASRIRVRFEPVDFNKLIDEVELPDYVTGQKYLHNYVEVMVGALVPGSCMEFRIEGLRDYVTPGSLSILFEQRGADRLMRRDTDGEDFESDVSWVMSDNWELVDAKEVRG